MTSEERRRLEKQLAEKGAQQSAYDSNKWKLGNDTYKFEGNNTLNNDGSKSHGYGNSKDRINKR